MSKEYIEKKMMGLYKNNPVFNYPQCLVEIEFLLGKRTEGSKFLSLDKKQAIKQKYNEFKNEQKEEEKINTNKIEKRKK